MTAGQDLQCRRAGLGDRRIETLYDHHGSTHADTDAPFDDCSASFALQQSIEQQPGTGWLETIANVWIPDAEKE